MLLKPFTTKRFRRRVFSQLWMISLQFLLGMTLNFIGWQATGTKHSVYISVLIAHILNAIGLLEGGLYIALKEGSKLAWWAATLIFVTFCGGVLTVLTKQDAWSFIMACGFLASAWLYVALYVRAGRRVQDKDI